MQGGSHVNEITAMLPEPIRQHILDLPPHVLQQMEEIRIRISKRVEVTAAGKPVFLSCIATHQDGISLLSELSQYSIYALEEELKRGFITIQGGHRVGLSGRVITENGRVKAIRNVTSFNIRVARQKRGIADRFIPCCYSGEWLNTMIIGPPQTGKTTMLRDFARIMSTGHGQIPSRKVGIVDERSEIAGCINGIPQHEFGERVDVLDACPKAEGMMMMIRSMSPDVLVVDEAGRMEDTEAILEAVHAGVGLFISVHGCSLEDIKMRPTIAPLLNHHVFKRFIELSRVSGPGTVQRVIDAQGRIVRTEEGVPLC